MKESKRIEWLDGFRGIACVLIFVHHFLLAFFPSVHFGEAAVSHGNGLDTALAQAPFSFFVNGGFLVALFCMISGVVFSIQVMKMRNTADLADLTVKRYFRLMLPLLPVAILVWGMLSLEWFGNLDASAYTESSWLAAYYREPISFGQMLKSALIDTWFWGDDRLSTAFWMLSTLFYGTFLSMLLSVITWKYPKRTWILYMLVVVFFFDSSTYLCAFALGTLLAWMYVNCQGSFSQAAGVLLLPIGLVLGAYPSGIQPTNFYRFLDGISALNWHILGALLTLYGFFSLPILQKAFSIKPFRSLGKISYAVYLLHIPLLFSLSAWIFLWTKDTLGYLYSVLLSFVFSLSLLLLLSTLYNRTVEKGCVWLQRKILRCFRDEE